MKLSARVKKFLVDECGVKATASDEEFRVAAAKALADGTLTIEKYQELTSTKSDEEEGEFRLLMKGLGAALGDLKQFIVDEKAKKPAAEPDGDEMEDDEEEAPPKKSPKVTSINDDKEDEENIDEDKPNTPVKPESGKSVKGKKGGTVAGTKHVPSALEKMVTRFGGIHSDDDGDEKSLSVRVKSAAEQYDGTKSAKVYPMQTEKGKAHPLAGKQVMNYSEVGAGRGIDNPSERDKAVAGAFGKFLVASASRKSKTLGFMALSDHDKSLLVYALENEKWGGATDGGMLADIKDRKLSPMEQKAVIDDSVSGGLEAAPIVFDDMVIQTPLLNGELYPRVTTVPLDRGRRVEGVAVANVTSSWGGVDDSTISLFNTTSYVTAFDTTIFRWEGAIRVGLDFLSDTPLDFGQFLTMQYGERLLEQLDNVIAAGNGSTQPEGVTVHVGTTSVNWGGSTTLGNYESLRFGVPKQEHRSNLISSAVFCGTEVSYQRAMAIPVGASDARRLSSVQQLASYDSYSWMNRPYAINNALPNSTIFYAILARYRMYRRRGLTMRSSTEGDTLIRANEMLLVATARYGGQLERGAVAAITTTAPA